jgi:hypothetical protein
VAGEATVPPEVDGGAVEQLLRTISAIPTKAIATPAVAGSRF